MIGQLFFATLVASMVILSNRSINKTIKQKDDMSKKMRHMAYLIKFLFTVTGLYALYIIFRPLLIDLFVKLYPLLY